MNQSPRMMLAAIGAAFLLVVSACGDDGAGTADPPSSTGDDDQAMDHGAGVEADRATSVSVEAFADASAGINVHITTTAFTFAPEHASLDPVDGEGHAHVYLDGTKVGRVYTDWYHLAATPGEHEVTVSLNANDHSHLLVDGEPVEASVTVTVPESDGHTHGDMAPHEVDAAQAPTLSVEVTDDAKSGFNVELTTTNFTFTPDEVNEAFVAGHGHAHIYVGDTKVARVYENWYHLDAADVPEGEQVVRVELNGNDHRPYAVDGQVVEATTTVIGTAESASADDHDMSTDDHAHTGDGETVDAETAEQTIEVLYENGAVDGGGRHDVALGTTLLLIVTSDVADEVHVHGYDILQELRPYETMEIAFVADLPGVYEVELEGSGTPLLEIQVS